MKCVECVDYAECSKKHNLTIKRKRCPIAKVEYVQTNADRIRAMSDEELADMLYETDSRIGNADLDEWLEWLKQPAEMRGEEDG